MCCLLGAFASSASLHPELDLALHEFIGLITREPLMKYGDVFGYHWVQSPNGPSNTMWLLYFYEQLEFYCTTCPQASIEGLTLEERSSAFGARPQKDWFSRLPTPAVG